MAVKKTKAATKSRRSKRRGTTEGEQALVRYRALNSFNLETATMRAEFEAAPEARPTLYRRQIVIGEKARRKELRRRERAREEREQNELLAELSGLPVRERKAPKSAFRETKFSQRNGLQVRANKATKFIVARKSPKNRRLKIKPGQKLKAQLARTQFKSRVRKNELRSSGSKVSPEVQAEAQALCWLGWRGPGVYAVKVEIVHKSGKDEISQWSSVPRQHVSSRSELEHLALSSLNEWAGSAGLYLMGAARGYIGQIEIERIESL